MKWCTSARVPHLKQSHRLRWVRKLLPCGRFALVGYGLLALSCAVASALPPQHAGLARPAAGYLGIDVRDVQDDELQSLKLKDARGAEIIRVDHDGPAGKMGLREHDVVVQMNGALIEGRDQIRKLLREMPPGRPVAMVISREGQQMTVTTQMADPSDVVREAWEQHLAAPPAQPAGVPLQDQLTASNQASIAPAPTAKYSKGFLGTILLTPAYTGVMLQRIGPQLAQYFGVPKGTGLLVTGIENNSPAQMAGIKAGDVVLRANTKTIVKADDWARVVRDAKGRPISVTVVRDKQERTVSLTPDAKKHS